MTDTFPVTSSPDSVPGPVESTPPGSVSYARVLLAVQACLWALAVLGGALVLTENASSGGGITAGIPVLAGLAGTALSSAAAVSLVRKPARRFTAPGA